MAAPPSSLSLDSIRSALIRQEDTIIFALIERAQHRQNASCYERGSANSYAVLAGKGASLLDFMLLETERLHARVRRYTSPDEHAFFPHRLPAPQLPMIDFEPVLHPCIVNLNGEIMDMYLSRVVPGLCGPGDDQQHGSSVVADIAALQAISKRVHYGFYVAESKFRAQPEQYTRLIEVGDEEGIMELLTNAAVEQRVLQRVRLKASTFGQEIEAPVSPSASPSAPSIAAPHTAGSSGGGGAARIDPDQIVAMYRDYVIPLTKVAEVQYLLQRLSSQQIAHHGAAGSACHKATVHRFVRSCPKGKAAPLLIRCSNVADVFGAVMANRATFGMVLLEQGDSGVLAVTRSLLRESSLRVVGEVVHDARFALYAKAALSAVRRVRARPGVLRLCAGWLADVLAGSIEMDEVELDPHGSHTPWEGVVELPEHETTAYLVEVDAKPHTALQLLASAPDSLSEYARSLVLAKARTVGGAQSGHDKSLLLFSTSSDSPGSLAQILAVFHEQGVNLRSIQSYASLQDAHMTDFFLEADGHEADGHFGSALRCLQAQRLAVNVKVLGSFAITASNLAEPLTPGGSLHGDARIE